ncbi:MAG: exodeoxyribonuclease VII large subunit [Pseudomonadota bacterium]
MEAATTNTPEYSVSEISTAVKRTVEDAFGYVRVRGELGRVSRPASGHIYTDLKDDRAVLSAVMWKGTANKLTFKPEEGLEVIATGRLTTFPGQSRYQLVVDRIEPAGIGALMKLLEERRRTLAAEGLFDEQRKRPLPFLPKTVGVVTSPTGAVIRDILHRLSDRTPVHVLVWPVRVQGETSAKEVTRAIEGFNALDTDGPVARPDVLIVARGGGSLEDLWSFNEENVARAAAASAIPLVSAVGHETDWTLIDYAADVRAPTPTGAAEMVVPVKADLIVATDDLGRRLVASTLRGIEGRRRDARSLARALPKLENLVNGPRQRLDAATLRLAHALKSGTIRNRGRYDGVASRVTPRLVLMGLQERRKSLRNVDQRLQRARTNLLAVKTESLRSVARQLSPRSIERRAVDGRKHLALAARRLARSIGVLQARKRDHLTQRAQLLDAFNYRNVLTRGFAVVRDNTGAPIRSVQALDQAGVFAVELADGHREASLVSSDKAERAKPARTKRVVDARPTPKQETLFD